MIAYLSFAGASSRNYRVLTGDTALLASYMVRSNLSQPNEPERVRFQHPITDG
jgi:hypothetical protein